MITTPQAEAKMCLNCQKTRIVTTDELRQMMRSNKPLTCKHCCCTDFKKINLPFWA